MVNILRITKAEGTLSDASVPPEEAPQDVITKNAVGRVFPIHESGVQTTIDALEAGDRGVTLEDVKSKLAKNG